MFILKPTSSTRLTLRIKLLPCFVVFFFRENFYTPNIYEIIIFDGVKTYYAFNIRFTFNIDVPLPI